MMIVRRYELWVVAAALAAGCSPDNTGLESRLAPTFANTTDRQTIVVNPNANGNGVAATIQAGIDRVAPGGTVLVGPGQYDEVLVIDKGLTLQGIGDGSGSVVIAPSGTPTTAVQIATTEPVTIRDVELRYGGVNGIRGSGIVDLSVERATLKAVNPPLGIGHVILVMNEGLPGRARLVVRDSRLDGGVPFANSPTPAFPQVFTVRTVGDVDALIERNVIRRAGGACVFITTRADLGGETNADILNNDLDECYPLGRAGAILVGPVGMLPSPRPPVTATGVVNTIGNTIRNSTGSCLLSAAINYEAHGGRVEHNRIINVVQSCAAETNRTLRGALFIGSQPARGFPQVQVVVRLNDFIGNAHADMRLAGNMTAPFDARCNYWGSATGPVVGSVVGSDIVVEAGGVAPAFEPFATAPIAETGATGC